MVIVTYYSLRLQVHILLFMLQFPGINQSSRGVRAKGQLQSITHEGSSDPEKDSLSTLCNPASSKTRQLFHIGSIYVSEALTEHALLCISDGKELWISIITRGGSQTKRLQGPGTADYKLTRGQGEGWPLFMWSITCLGWYLSIWAGIASHKYD